MLCTLALIYCPSPFFPSSLIPIFYIHSSYSPSFPSFLPSLPPPSSPPTLPQYTDSSSDSQSIPYYLVVFLWIVSAIVSTCYTFTWDIKMDWGLFEGKYKLRSELIYSKKVYSFSIQSYSVICLPYSVKLRQFECHLTLYLLF